MKLTTHFGIFSCEENLAKTPKCLLQSVLKFLNVDCGRKATKKDICHFITKYKEIEKEIRTKKLKKRPLVELLANETEDEKNHRLRGGKLKEREWNVIDEKCKKFFD